MKPTAILRTLMLLAVATVMVGCASGVNLPERTTVRETAQDPRIVSEPPAQRAEIPGKTGAGSASLREPPPRVTLLRRRTVARTGGLSRQAFPQRPDRDASNPVETPSARQARWKAVPPGHKPTPQVNSPEWQKEQAEAEKRERELDRKIRSICGHC
jgi:hypothetical protein